MIKSIIFVLVCSLSLQALAFDDDEREIFKVSVSGEEFQPSEIMVKEAVIKSFLAYRWKITEHNRFKIKATYKNRCIVEATINGSTVEFLEVSSPNCVTFRESWIKSLGNAFIQYVETDYHINKAKELMASIDV